MLSVPVICWSCFLWFVSFRRRRQSPSANLLHQREKISHTPVLGDLAVADAHHVDSLEVNFAVSWSDAEEISFVCSVVCLVRDHPVAIGKLPMDLWVKVGKRVANIAVELTHTGFVRSHVWLRCVVDEIVREELFEDVKSSFALDFFGISAYDGFRRI